MEQTLSIIKPDAVAQNKIGAIIAYIEKGGLRVIAQKMTHLTEEQAQAFYSVHKERPFFSDLVKFMTSGPVVIMTLEGEGAIARYREIMGATNPQDAAPGTIRADFATNIEENAVHGSDAPETANFEVSFFFGPEEIKARTR